MDINDVHEIFRLTSVGLSRQEVASRLGVAKSTVQRYLEIIKTAGITPEQASATTTVELELLVCSEPGVSAGFVRPDFEWIYNRHHVRGKHRFCGRRSQMNNSGASAPEPPPSPPGGSGEWAAAAEPLHPLSLCPGYGRSSFCQGVAA